MVDCSIFFCDITFITPSVHRLVTYKSYQKFIYRNYSHEIIHTLYGISCTICASSFHIDFGLVSIYVSTYQNFAVLTNLIRNICTYLYIMIFSLTFVPAEPSYAIFALNESIVTE